LGLFRPAIKSPIWAQLPAEAHTQTVALLAQLLRLHRRSRLAAQGGRQVRDE
jgi:hypothetical protein